METTYDTYRRRYTVEDSSPREPAEVEAESDPVEAALREQVRALKQQLAVLEAELAEAEQTFITR